MALAHYLTLTLVLLFPLSATAMDKVRLQLKWQPQFQFAGYYAAEAQGYYKEAGIEFTLLPHGYHVKDLLTGDVDAMSTYVTDEPFELITAGQEYLLYSPRSTGIDFYGDNLFTTESQIRQKPERVKAFREASLKGWEYAMKHTEELVQLIYSKYSKRHSLEHLRFEAHQMAPLLQTVESTGSGSGIQMATAPQILIPKISYAGWFLVM